MKRKITLLFLSLFSITTFAQDKSYSLLRDKTETKILYDQVFGISNAVEQRKLDITTNYFLQVYHGIQRSDFLQRLPTLEKLREAAQLGLVQNQVPLSILISDFEKINQTAIENGDLFLTPNNQYQLKSNAQNAFNKHSVNLISPLLSKVNTNQVRFILKDELIFNTTDRTIRSISIQTNGEETWKTISINSPFVVNFNTPGKQTLYCKIAFTNGRSTIVSFTIDSTIQNSSVANRNSGNNYQPNAIVSITATIPYQGYGEAAAYLGQGEYEIFPDTVDGILDKPVFLIDGFDPGDGNTIPLIYSGLNYGVGQNLADYLRSLGFDIILVNFPTYTRPSTTTVVDGGADFIQRNAFVLVELINQINAQKVGTQKNVVIGPSMGGLIARYALRYMEMNALNHDTRLYISFDSPHQGANIPIGFQHLFNYMAYGPLANAAVQPLVDGMIKSPAARQMLIDHFEGHLQAGSAFEFNTASATLVPTGSPNYRNAFQNELNAMGFPTTVRNVAISNGAGNGTMNYSPDFEVMNHTFNVTATQRAIINLRFTPAANLTNQVSRFRGQTLIFTWFTVYESMANSKAPTYTDGLDTAPGGRFDMTGLGADLGTDPLLTEFFNSLNADYFTFIPTWSSMAISNTNNLYTPVTGASVTPFVASSIPTVNENHVTLTQANITITDMLGKTIYTSKNQTISGTLEIPVTLTNGVYLVTIGNEKGNITKKIVKS